MVTKSPLSIIFERPDFKPFSGKRAFKILQLTKSILPIPPFRLEDILKAVSSIGLISDNEVTLLVSLQGQLCIKCGNCCRSRGSIKITKNELNKIASIKNKSYKKMKQELKATPLGNGKFRVSQPCKFFIKSVCEVYDSRPSTCTNFPTNEILNNLVNGIDVIICPIINDLLKEIVIKRVIEEKMYRDNPEIFNKNKEKLLKEQFSLTSLPQNERIKMMIAKSHSIL
jgi:Fe-S-cluster containining protein